MSNRTLPLQKSRTLNMATWHMCLDAGNNYRWYPDPKPEAINGVVCRPSESDRSSSRRLPSMGDVLLQGCSKLAEAEIRNQVVEGGGAGMFRNGFGKPVAVKQSSLAKASSLLLGSQIATPSGPGTLTLCSVSIFNFSFNFNFNIIFYATSRFRI